MYNSVTNRNNMQIYVALQSNTIKSWASGTNCYHLTCCKAPVPLCGCSRHGRELQRRTELRNITAF